MLAARRAEREAKDRRSGTPEKKDDLPEL